MDKKLLIFTIIFLLLTVMRSKAQEILPKEKYLQTPIEQKSFDKAVWKKTIAGVDYRKGFDEVDIDDDGEGIGQPFENKTSDQNKSIFQWNIGSGWDIFFKVIFISLLIGTIGFILYRVIIASTNRPKERKLTEQKMTIDLEEIEENLHESDLDRFIRQAIDQEDYPLAVRLYYLAIIKELSLKHLIKWKRDKTNNDYLEEVKHPKLKTSFIGATQVFEQVWYGKAPLDAENFTNLRPAFQQFIQTINQFPNNTHAK